MAKTKTRARKNGHYGKRQSQQQTPAQFQRTKYSILGAGSADTIKLKVTKERAQMMSVGLYKAASHDPAAQADVVALFMVNKNDEYYQDISKAVDRLDALPLLELQPLFQTVLDGVESLAAPQ